ncbi:MFS transporter [Reticulibacter mediterranei]|uniref:MFS transporter n=2 Tax=Reticulibacter mediterranei TaxID=2778369 RepID=A0A8J3IEQ9_9CHLR|nr:MFS transporter [Reticulibacter mediterranei]
MTAVVFPLLVYRMTHSPLLTALISVCDIAPYPVFALFAGTLADRVNRRRLMITCDLVNALLLGSIPLSSLLHALTLAQIYIVGLLSATAFVWFDAANFGAVPALVGRRRLIAANSALWTASTMTDIVGPSLAGLCIVLVGPAITISADSASYLLSALSLALIPRAFNQLRHREGTRSWLRSSMSDIREGLHFLWQHALVRTLTLLGIGCALTAGAVQGLLVVYGIHALGLTTTDPRIGLLFGAGATGALVSNLLLPVLVKNVAVGRITMVGLLLNLLLLVAVALAPTFLTGMLCYGLWLGCNHLVNINGISLRQIVTPDHLQSRVNASARMVMVAANPLGAALGGILAEQTTVRISLLIMASGVALSLFLSWFSPLWLVQTPKGVEQEERGGSHAMQP